MSIWNVNPSEIHHAPCETCQQATEHVDVLEKTLCWMTGNGGHHEMQIRELWMCLVCWTKRPPEGDRIDG